MIRRHQFGLCVYCVLYHVSWDSYSYKLRCMKSTLIKVKPFSKKYCGIAEINFWTHLSHTLTAFLHRVTHSRPFLFFDRKFVLLNPLNHFVEREREKKCHITIDRPTYAYIIQTYITHTNRTFECQKKH